MKKQILIVLSVLIAIGTYGQKVINIRDKGACSSNQTGNTAIIQQAIDDMSAAGGGTVVVPPGRFVIGVINMKSGVNLHLEKYAVLVGSPYRLAYGKSVASALITAENEHNISITGAGIIDGQGMKIIEDLYKNLKAGILEDSDWQTPNPWHDPRPEERNRPKIIVFNQCKNVVLKGITIRNAANWVQRYNKCTDILVDSMTVESNEYWNNDGIDFVDCKNVILRNSFFNSDDDGICMKSEDRNDCCDNILIENCVVRSSANAVKMGTSSKGGFKNITIKNIRVFDTYRSAIAVECVDGGILENVRVENIWATNTGNAILIRLGHRNKDSVVSTLRNVHIKNMIVEVPKIKPDKGYNIEGPPKKYPHNVFPSSITGIAGQYIDNVTIEDVNIVYEGGGDRQTAHFGLDSIQNIPECLACYPEFSMFGELPAWGFYVRHVNGLNFKNVTVSFKENDFRPAMIFDDVTGLKLENTSVLSASEMAVMVFRNVKKPVIKELKLPVDVKKGLLYLK